MKTDLYKYKRFIDTYIIGAFILSVVFNLFLIGKQSVSRTNADTNIYEQAEIEKEQKVYNYYIVPIVVSNTGDFMLGNREKFMYGIVEFGDSIKFDIVNVDSALNMLYRPNANVNIVFAKNNERHEYAESKTNRNLLPHHIQSKVVE